MALTGNKIDLILGLKLNEFFAANKQAAATYYKTKGQIENKPIRMKETGTAGLKQTWPILQPWVSKILWKWAKG